MSFGGFGFSIGDAFAIGQLAWNVYKSCKSAQGEFAWVLKEVASLHTAINEISDQARNPQSVLHRADESKKRQLESLLSSCWSVLGELDDLVRRHRRLESERPGVLDKLRFSAKDPSRFRERLVLLVTTIGLFLAGLGTSSLANIEDKLDEIVAEIRNGKRESTTFVFVGENEVSNAQWRRLADELESKDIESEAINANRLGIAAYLHEQIERYELDKSHASDGAMPPEDERLANSGISRRRNHNRDQTNRPELSGFGNARSIVPSLPPTRPLPALPCIPETSSVRSPDLSYTMAMAPPLSRSAGSSYQRSPSGLYETTTETEEYDERGLLRKRTITRHSSTSSFGSSLASTNTSLSLGPSITQTPTDLEAEPECIDFCPDTLAERVTELAERPISLNGPNPPQSPKLSRTSSLNTEFEVWEDETRCLREMLSKQSMQIEQLTRQRDHYKSQLEESGDLQRLQLHRFCSASVSSAFPALPETMRDPIPHDNLDFRETQHSGEKDYVEKHLTLPPGLDLNSSRAVPDPPPLRSSSDYQERSSPKKKCIIRRSQALIRQAFKSSEAGTV